MRPTNMNETTSATMAIQPPVPDSSLSDKDLEGLYGGTAIPVTGPVLKPTVPGSIAQGDTISINDNLPDAGGGVIR